MIVLTGTIATMVAVPVRRHVGVTTGIGDNELDADGNVVIPQGGEETEDDEGGAHG